MFKSNVCRIEPSFELVDFLEGKGAGMHEIPSNLLEPRQVKVTNVAGAGSTAATLRFHRGSLVPVVTRKVAEAMVADNIAEWCPQSALVYTRENYLYDKDVQANQLEYDQARQSGEALVLVAIVGESRSPLAVCRNIVSGCCKLDSVYEEAKGAIEASNTLLVED